LVEVERWSLAPKAAREFSRSVSLGEIYNSEDRTWPAGRKKPNDFGLFDMLGNTWVWCQNAVVPAPPPLPGEVLLDKECLVPLGQKPGRWIRGGSFVNRPYILRAAYRDGRNGPADEYNANGFRIVQTVR
jgi:formylglycine-generating enzyme required for sulfatase activity